MPAPQHPMRLLLADMPTSFADGLRERRIQLGLSEQDVSKQLLLSLAQVRAIETDSQIPFYNEGFFERARIKYVALLRVRSRSVDDRGSQLSPSAPRLTLDSTS